MVPKSITEQPLLEARDGANKFNRTKEELEIYDYWSMREQDGRGATELAVEEAVEKVVIGLHKNGIDIEIIASSSGLSVEEVEEIIKKNKL